MSLPLFEAYPGLAARLSRLPLGTLPTPVRRMEALGRETGASRLYLKDDGVSGPLYGGNKVRKLEFLLAGAEAGGAREVMTFGCAGSNHALATALYARARGMGGISMLFPQPNARYVRRNLLMGGRSGAELRHYGDFPAMEAAVGNVLRAHRERTGAEPAVIPAGGSSPLGTVGFVNAAFELRAQIRGGLLPEPDELYVPLGTAGTAVGLMIGLKAAGLGTRVVPVRVVDPAFMTPETVRALFDGTVSFIRSLDPSFPAVRLETGEPAVEDGFLGDGYAVFTPAGTEAAELCFRTEGLALDGTYTGKTMAALISSLRGAAAGRTLLFWNTLNRVDFSRQIEGVDYRSLPCGFHRYFEDPVQPLDRSASSSSPSV